MKFATAISKFISTSVLVTALLLGTIPAPAQCDGLPHPENGRPAPCTQPTQTPTSPNSGANWRLADQQRQQQQQQEVAERQQQERDRIHRCELQAQHDYDGCKQNNPNGYCPLKQCN